MGGGGNAAPPPVVVPPTPTKDYTQIKADQEMSILRRRGRTSTMGGPGVNGEPDRSNLATSVLVSGGSGTSLGSTGK